jgi:hypothetical protein
MENKCKVCEKGCPRERHICKDCQPAVEYGVLEGARQMKAHIDNLFKTLEEDIAREKKRTVEIDKEEDGTTKVD